jgi:hypothetical protein
VVRRVKDEKLNGSGGREKSKGTVFSVACI